MFGKKWKQLKESGKIQDVVQGAVQGAAGALQNQKPAPKKEPIPPHFIMAGAILLAAVLGSRR
jgi:hypothetical protein